MKQALNPRRGRNRSSGKRNSSQSSRNRNYDGSGSDNRVRGSSQQILDKYLSLARDASLTGDRIAAEGYHQHAEHYYRVLNPEPSAEGNQGASQQNRKPRYEKKPNNQRENQPRPDQQQQSSEQVEASVTTPEPVAEVTTPEPVVEVAEVVETPAPEPQASNEQGTEEKPRRRGRPRKVVTAEPAA